MKESGLIETWSEELLRSCLDQNLIPVPAPRIPVPTPRIPVPTPRIPVPAPRISVGVRTRAEQTSIRAFRLSFVHQENQDANI